MKAEVRRSSESRIAWQPMLKACSCRATSWPWLQRRRWTWSGSPACSSSSPAHSNSRWTHPLTPYQHQPIWSAGYMELQTSANCVVTKAPQITSWTVAQWCSSRTGRRGDTAIWSTSLSTIWTSQDSRYTVICQAGKHLVGEPFPHNYVRQG